MFRFRHKESRGSLSSLVSERSLSAYWYSSVFMSQPGDQEYANELTHVQYVCKLYVCT
jgi:hypothetical protein